MTPYLGELQHLQIAVLGVCSAELLWEPEGFFGLCHLLRKRQVTVQQPKIAVAIVEELNLILTEPFQL